MPRVGFDPANVNHATKKFTVGGVYWHDGKQYRYVKVVDATAAANGDVMLTASATDWDVTSDFAGGSALGTMCAGVAVGTISQNQYGFILVSGIHDAIKEAGNTVTAGLYLVPDTGPVNGNCEAVGSANEEAVFGECLTAAASGTLIGLVNRCA